MSARLTVVLDDEELYRRLKVRAAQDGVAMKDLVQAGLRLALDEPLPIDGRVALQTEPAHEGKAFDWDRYDEMMEQWKAQDEESGALASAPTDLSDVKRHLYGNRDPRDEGIRRVAEERAPYDAD